MISSMVRVRRLRIGRGPLEKAEDVEDEVAILSEDKERATVNVGRGFALSSSMERKQAETRCSRVLEGRSRD